jgi:hypothetical protein
LRGGLRLRLLFRRRLLRRRARVLLRRGRARESGEQDDGGERSFNWIGVRQHDLLSLPGVPSCLNLKLVRAAFDDFMLARRNLRQASARDGLQISHGGAEGTHGHRAVVGIVE